MAARAAKLYDSNQPCAAEANGTKFLGARAGYQACLQAVLTHGGMGYAKEYVEMMWVMLQQDQADDYVVATNETHTVREFIQETFGLLNLDWEKYVSYDARYERPAEVELLIGDPAKAKRQLGWEPKTKFKELVKIMTEADLELAKREAQIANLPQPANAPIA